jgi:CheY-like chemotaxis protein
MAEDHEEFLPAERRLLVPDLELIETVPDGQAAARLAPEPLVRDLSMPGMGGIEAARLRADADRSAPAWRAGILELLDRRAAVLRRFPCLWHSARRCDRRMALA